MQLLFGSVSAENNGIEFLAFTKTYKVIMHPVYPKPVYIELDNTKIKIWCYRSIHSLNKMDNNKLI